MGKDSCRVGTQSKRRILWETLEESMRNGCYIPDEPYTHTNVMANINLLLLSSLK